MLQVARCWGKVSSCGHPSCYSSRRCYPELLTHYSLLASSGWEEPSEAERSGLPSGATGKQVTPLRSSQRRSLRRTGSHTGAIVPARRLRIFACEQRTVSTVSDRNVRIRTASLVCATIKLINQFVLWPYNQNAAQHICFYYRNKIQCLYHKVFLDYILVLLIISGTKWEAIHKKIFLVTDTKLHKCRHKNLTTDFTGAG